MFSRLDYSSATFAGVLKQLMDRLQSMQNAADLQSLSSGPHSAITAVITLALDARTRFCTWLPGFRSSARVTPQRTSTTVLFDYISIRRSMHYAFYHWRLHPSSDCCIGLEQFARVSTVIAVVASFPQQTENRNFCLVLQT